MAKTQKHLKNTKNRSCRVRNMTACCPHMEPTESGRYQKTNEKTKISLAGKKYYVYTCCKMCGLVMKELAKENPEKFKKQYNARENRKGELKLSNKHTGKHVQNAPRA